MTELSGGEQKRRGESGTKMGRRKDEKGERSQKRKRKARDIIERVLRGW